MRVSFKERGALNEVGTLQSCVAQPSPAVATAAVGSRRRVWVAGGLPVDAAPDTADHISLEFTERSHSNGGMAGQLALRALADSGRAPATTTVVAVVSVRYAARIRTNERDRGSFFSDDREPASGWEAVAQ